MTGKSNCRISGNAFKSAIEAELLESQMTCHSEIAHGRPSEMNGGWTIAPEILMLLHWVHRRIVQTGAFIPRLNYST